MAILVRASFQMREFEDRFVTLGLNYRVIGGPRFYERLEIRDAMAFLRVVAQPADDLAFERIVNVPKRGLGEATIAQVHATARALGVPMLEAAGKLAESDELKPKPRAALREVFANFTRWQERLETTPHTELAEIILDESGYTEMWKNDRSAEAPGRLENLKELIRGMEEYRVAALLPRTCRAGHGCRAERAARRRLDHDAAFGQGPGVRDRVPARLGGRPVSAPARAGRRRPLRP
jgi:DNA helicase-2/ATP-dependent DNA helicase PcrA